MIKYILINVIAPFVGTGAYVVLFNVPRQYYFCCGVTGTSAWLVYQAALQWTFPPVAAFFAAAVAVLLARVLTVYKKCPITIFLLAGIIPLVPGAGIYRTAYYLVVGRLGIAAAQGVEAVKIAFGIVIGIAFAVSVPKEMFMAIYRRAERRGKG